MLARSRNIEVRSARASDVVVGARVGVRGVAVSRRCRGVLFVCANSQTTCFPRRIIARRVPRGANRRDADSARRARRIATRASRSRCRARRRSRARSRRARARATRRDGARDGSRAATGVACVARSSREDATRRRAIDASDANAVARAAAALRRGGVIAVPTDTIYGFAASAANGDAVRRLYEIKGRRAGVPLAIAVGDVRDVGTYGDDGHLREGALARLLPGPTTVLLRRRRGDAGRATPELNPGVDLIGIRVPAHDFVREVCRAHGGAIALTSANRSGETSATAAEEFAELWDACDEVFDGGAIPAKRLGSTIVDLSSRANDFAIVRAGERCDELVRVLEGEFAMTRRDA